MSTPSDYEKKLIEMRYQMQENQLYMQDTFKDLENWTNDIKEKEKKVLEDPSILKNSNKGLPPIRNLATPKKKKKIKKEVKEVKENKLAKSKINSYDYRAWDKLDVDKLCEEVDNQKTSSSDYTTDEEYEEEQRKVKANWEKERGNQFFKDNLLNEAINCYTRAIELDPNNAIYPANRAMCLIKQEKYAAAENDCTLSIALDSNYAKAYHRRATCRTNLKRYEEAKNDIEMLLKLEPNSKVAQQELAKLEELINEKHLIFPIVKKENEKSKKPLKRIEIQEINDESNERLELEKSLSQRVQLTAKEQSLFEIPKKEEKKVIEIIENVEHKPTESKSQAKEEIEKQTELKPNVREMPEKPIEIKGNKKQIPEAPSNGYQFKKDWQFLSNDLDSLAVYFKKINPVNYEKLFLNGLESDNLSKILTIYKQYFLKDSDLDLYLYMNYLSKTKRFQTQLMFLTDSDKKTIDELFNHLKTLNEHDLKEIEKLQENYKF